MLLLDIFFISTFLIYRNLIKLEKLYLIPINFIINFIIIPAISQSNIVRLKNAIV